MAAERGCQIFSVVITKGWTGDFTDTTAMDGEELMLLYNRDFCLKGHDFACLDHKRKFGGFGIVVSA